MATTTASFRAEQRDALSDLGVTPTFSNAQLDRFRDAELRNLYSYGLGQETTNFAGTKTDMDLATTTATDWAIPSGWLRITGVEYWTNETVPQFYEDSALWDDRVRSSYVTIWDAPDHFDYRIKLIGLKGWSGIDDSAMPQEIIDVCLYGSLLRAVTSLANKRAASRRNAAASRSSDTSLGSIAFWRRQLRDDLEMAKRNARRSPRPIGV